MDYNGLWEKLNKIISNTDWTQSDSGDFDKKIEAVFEQSILPPELGKAISAAIEDSFKKKKKKLRLLFAVRSSAVGEDEEGKSYAGQFDTVLDCNVNEINKAFTKVISSRFKYSVGVYNGETGMMPDPEKLAMSVGIQEMIDSDTAGVVYTSDPAGIQKNSMFISAVKGSGSGIVSGMVDSDYYQVSRLDPTKIIIRRIGELRREELNEIYDKSKACKPYLTNRQITELAGMAIILDRYFKHPQDIEWCVDAEGKFHILQCRPLNISKRVMISTEKLREIIEHKEIIMRNQGQIAQRGIAAGKAHHISEDENPASFPIGAIAITKYASPRLTSIIRRASAIITDVGSSTGHMATVAREFGVPMIIGVVNAVELIAEGSEITVDAEENIIYRGIVEELLEYEMEGEDIYRDLKEYKILKQILRKVTPLHLIDPYSAAFSEKNWRSYHDILRFSHEKAMQELADINLKSKKFSKIKARPLKLSIPLGLSVIDIGGGVEPDSRGNIIESMEMIISIPMKAILTGLTSPGVWSTEPVQMDMSDFISSMTRYSMTDRNTSYQGQNLAVIGANYANLSLRLGYHFNVIDTYISEDINANYIYFRFVGGVTENERRYRRALLLKQIM